MVDGIVLFTIPKSGTNYLKLLVANFLNIYFEHRSDPTMYDEMHRSMFYTDQQIRGLDPNHDVEKSPAVVKYTGFRALIHTHDVGMLLPPSKNPDGRYVFLYRNPLDYLISNYFYSYRNRLASRELFSHPRESIPLLLPQFIAARQSQLFLAKDCSNVLVVAYEDLFEDPKNVLGRVLRHINLELSDADSAVDRAIDFSSMNVVREHERKRGSAIHADPSFDGSFVRSGAIAQWKEFFTDDDVQAVDSSLAEAGLRLQDFRIE